MCRLWFTLYDDCPHDNSQLLVCQHYWNGLFSLCWRPALTEVIESACDKCVGLKEWKPWAKTYPWDHAIEQAFNRQLKAGGEAGMKNAWREIKQKTMEVRKLERQKRQWIQYEEENDREREHQAKRLKSETSREGIEEGKEGVNTIDGGEGEDLSSLTEGSEESEIISREDQHMSDKCEQ